MLGLYPGLSASIFRQMTYSITRFGAYEAFKDVLREQCTSSSSREARARLRVWRWSLALTELPSSPPDFV